LTMTGPIAEATLNRFYADICILGAAGVDAQVGVTELDYEIASLHRLMMERSRRVLVLADHSKLGFRAPAVVAPASMVTTLVTDDAAPPEMLAQLQACGMQVIFAGKRTSERASEAVQ
jgi:DeoR family transcriptional regulator, fructose operon transcriptional repressor